MRAAALLILFLASGCQALAPESALPQPADSNLLEYGCGHFGDRDYGEAVPDFEPARAEALPGWSVGGTNRRGTLGSEAVPEPPRPVAATRGAGDGRRPPGEHRGWEKAASDARGLCYVLLGAGETEVLRVFE